MAADDRGSSIKGDRALGVGDEDKLGFREIAKRIASSLVDRSSENGLVVGVEGAWGSGKSSLIFLIGDELKKLPNDRKPTVINFRPWLIGNRDALISGLFGELSKQLDEIALGEGDATRIAYTKAKEAREALRRFTKALSKAASAVDLVGEMPGLGAAKLVSKGLKAAGEGFDEKAASPPLSELKENLATSLRNLGHRFIVTVDDVDRLEPSEVIEILRLVRSVVDLPNVIYLLCYDSDILGHSIEKAANIKCGRSYLEKIVQLTIMVPTPEIQLRQWFSDELHSIAAVKKKEELSRLKVVIDYEGGRQLRTPRSVVRALDAIRFFWPPLREAEADLADLVWLQFVKNGNPALYRWIERYCATVSIVSLGTARVEDAEKAEELGKLLGTVADGHFNDLTYRYNFAEPLPGVKVEHSSAEFKIFEPVDERDLNEAINRKRLASPDHYRLYFALSCPSHALTREESSSIWTAAATSAKQAGEALLQLHREHATVSLSRADILLERVHDAAAEVLRPEQCENLLIAFSLVMDEAYRRRPFDMFWVNSFWDRAQKLLPLLLSRLGPERRVAVVTEMFGKGEAISWLTSLFRRETFAHGRYGDDQRSKDRWLFTDAELDQITALMLDRYRAMSADDVLRCPSPISLLFAWNQGGDPHGARRLVEEKIASDEGLIMMMESLSTTIRSGDRRTFKVLKEINLAPFMDYGTAKQRIEKLRRDADFGARAQRLAVALDEGTAY